MTLKQGSFPYNLFSGFFAGIMIGIGGVVCLSCENKVVGSVLFAVGLFAICTYGLKLFTGAIGYLLTEGGRPLSARLLDALAIWLGNLCGTVLVGFAAAWMKPVLGAKALDLSNAKLSLSLPKAFVLAAFCGLLMYLAVDIYRNQQGVHRLVGIFVAVPVFILSGFEHSVADMFYFAAGLRINMVLATVTLLVITLGNAFGAWAFAAGINRIKSAKN